MNSEWDDHTLDNAIRRALRPELMRFDSAQWKRDHPEEVQQLQYGKPLPTRRWRIRAIKVAVLVLFVGTGIIALLTVANNGSDNRVFAQVVRQMRTRSYTFTLEDRRPDGTIDNVCRVMVLEPGRVRFEASAGGMTSIVNASTGEGLILFEKLKVAQRIDREQREQTGPFDFLILPERSVEKLWNLRAGEEKPLGRRLVAGKQAEGFQIVREDNEFHQLIRVWADTRSGAPLEIEVIITPMKRQEEPIMSILRDFDLSTQLDEQLFSTEPPEGYALANYRSLQDLLDEQRAQTAPTAGPTQAEPLLKALELWAQGQTEQATAQLLRVDWAGEFQFAPDQHLFTLTEKQLVSLTEVDRQKITEQLLQQLSPVRALAKEVVRRGKDLAASGKHADAELHYLAVASLGRLLNPTSEGVLIVRLVGIAAQHLALQPLEGLYETAGETVKLQQVRQQQQELNRQHEEIRQKAGG